MCASQIPVKINAVGHFRHQHLAKPHTKARLLILKNCSICIPTRVRGVVVGPIINDRPVRELEMAVAADGIRIEEIGRAEFTEANLQPLLRNRF